MVDLFVSLGTLYRGCPSGWIVYRKTLGTAFSLSLHTKGLGSNQAQFNEDAAAIISLLFFNFCCCCCYCCNCCWWWWWGWWWWWWWVFCCSCWKNVGSWFCFIAVSVVVAVVDVVLVLLFDNVHTPFLIVIWLVLLPLSKIISTIAAIIVDYNAYGCLALSLFW